MNPNTNISQELLESVERYFNGNMTADELSAFEGKLKSDIDFQTQVEDIRTLLFGIESQSLKEQLDDFHNEIPNTSAKKAQSKVRFLHFGKIAAAAIVVIAIANFWFFNQSPNEKLYANFFSPDPGLATTMSSNSNFEFYDAMVNYKQGDYKAAISKWTTIHQSKPKNDTLNYFLGVAYMANKNESKAITYLEKAIEEPTSNFKSEAYYYLGLAYLKEGHIEKAKSSLENSNNNNSKALLSALNN
ncbi:tetratricopeptide repeat protein [uncultured Psychroserpens sp.]|uniref:tetratricopeptide repeat protein n=1 Tax=uncultured Psychroserpens sp. TaxID=255436 RepID=UPI00261BD3E0|nr:tetratricopeptide repeat protein [uncultured Psychroserpens sp.]